jgi:hypothetical protein
MRDLALQAAGVLAILVAIAHGIIVERKVFASVRIEPQRTSGLLRMLCQASTVDWIGIGVLLIAAPALGSDAARLWIIAVAVIVYGYAATLLGDEFKIVPEFTLRAEQADEWDRALLASEELLSHLTTDEIEFPLDEWLYGVARVREKMGQWEQTMLMSQALAGKELLLEPMQLPHAPGDRWLGLDFPVATKIEGDRLLYTAHYAKPFDKTSPGSRRAGGAI